MVMQRTAEPELMNDLAQVDAYSRADFSSSNARFVAQTVALFPGLPAQGAVLDIGCGPGDITLRLARALPGCVLRGTDGAENMIARARCALLVEPDLKPRVHFAVARLPEAQSARAAYDLIVSNSVLHHLTDPLDLWRAIRAHGRPGTAVHVVDLRRPSSRVEARELVSRYTTPADSPLLREDYFNSLLAAYETAEVAAQLRDAQLPRLNVQAVGDRYLSVIGWLD
jgi:trans-aconitate methyltransferase